MNKKKLMKNNYKKKQKIGKNNSQLDLQKLIDVTQLTKTFSNTLV